MNADMSLLGLFTNASLLVQMVMLLLMVASVFSWTVILQRGQFLRASRNATNDFEFNFWSGIDLTKLYNKLSGRDKRLSGLEAIFVAGFREYARLKKQNIHHPDIYLENVERVMRVTVAGEESKLERNLPFLATIQSMSPYVGLFGTVWGIMNSFRQLGTVQQATLAMVAPGISEALIATAMGLVAAIPAGIAYNRYISRVDDLSLKYRMFVEEFITIMQRRIASGSGGNFSGGDDD
jgi:biopolymer transport protein TolQ